MNPIETPFCPWQKAIIQQKHVIILKMHNGMENGQVVSWILFVKGLIYNGDCLC